MDKLWNKFVLKYKKVSCGKNLCIEGKLYVHGSRGCIKIGDGCTIYSTEQFNPTTGFNHTHFVVANGGLLTIGNNVGMSHVNITAYSRVTIENDVLIGSGVKIWDTDFHFINYDARMKHPDTTVKSAPILICEGVFIGACSIILKGVTIGKHAVIGAGSVVSKNIPENEIWAGNPAKKIGNIGGDDT